eukprot:g44630.t1
MHLTEPWTAAMENQIQQNMQWLLEMRKELHFSHWWSAAMARRKRDERLQPHSRCSFHSRRNLAHDPQKFPLRIREMPYPSILPATIKCWKQRSVGTSCLSDFLCMTMLRSVMQKVMFLLVKVFLLRRLLPLSQFFSIHHIPCLSTP